MNLFWHMKLLKKNRLKLVWLVILVGFAVPSTQSEESAKVIDAPKGCYALIIGNSKYTHWEHLNSIPGEMEDLKRCLRNCGFKIFNNRVHTDLDSAQLEELTQSFILECGIGNKNRNNRILIYFAGHGELVGDLGYAIGVDTKPHPSADFMKKAIPLDDFRILAKQADCFQSLFIFDCCYSGMVMDTKRNGRSHLSKARQLFAVSDASRTAPGKSVFVREFISGVDGEGDLNDDGLITASELKVYIKDRISLEHPGEDVPKPQLGCIAKYEFGDFVFGSLPSIESRAVLPSTGYFDIRTIISWPGLEELPSDLYPHALKEVQSRLFNSGFFGAANTDRSLIVDGVMGPQTQEAIFKYQECFQLVRSGVVDERTAKALGLPDKISFFLDAKTISESSLKQSIDEFLANWEKAWESRDLESYISFYTDDFKGVSYSVTTRKDKNLSLEEWRRDKGEKFRSAQSINVNISGLSDPATLSSGLVKVSFDQAYSSLNTSGVKYPQNGFDRGSKALTLKLVDSKFSIVEERFTPSGVW